MSQPTDERTAALIEALSATPGVTVREEEPLSRHTPLRVGGPAQVWAVVEHEDALREVLRAARRIRVNWRVHWPFGDWLVRDGGVRGLVIRPGRGFEGLSRAEDGTVWLGAAALWASLTDEPGALGGLARWSGSVGGLFDSGDQARLTGLCTSVRYLTGRRIEEVAVPADEPPPALPSTAVLIAVGLDPQPAARGTLPPPARAGVLFSVVDGEGVEALLRVAGLTGARLRSWRVSSVEPGTVIQLGGGSCRDVLLLAQGLRERVEKEQGVALEHRLPIIGTDARP